MKPRTRCMMWVRPSYRTYAYNLGKIKLQENLEAIEVRR